MTVASSSASSTAKRSLVGGLDLVMTIGLSPVLPTVKDTVLLSPTVTVPKSQPSAGVSVSFGPRPALPDRPTILSPAVVCRIKSSLNSPTAVGL